MGRSEEATNLYTLMSADVGLVPLTGLRWVPRHSLSPRHNPRDSTKKGLKLFFRTCMYVSTLGIGAGSVAAVT
jgi:hypothetical protein